MFFPDIQEEIPPKRMYTFNGPQATLTGSLAAVCIEI
jgi:hypothetical protein